MDRSLAEVLLGAEDLGQTETALSKSLNALANVTPGDAPLQTDRTLSSDAYGVEYHVWPAAAAGAWLMLAQSGPAWIDVGGAS